MISTQVYFHRHKRGHGPGLQNVTRAREKGGIVISTQKPRRLTPVQALIVGFALIIFTGSILLSLPCASRGGTGMAFIDALFTATSATCVTGLVVADTYTQFTFFGQLVILTLIQVGGLGFMTMAITIPLVLGRRIGLKQRTYLAEALSSMQIGGVVRLVRLILLGTLLFEGIGALLLTIRFCQMFNFWTALWFGIFHAVSAFCNAGFDLMGIVMPGGSLSIFAGDIYVNLVIMTLVIIGGIGFLVWSDIVKNKFHWKSYRLHTKLMLSSTAILIVVPVVIYLIVERDGAFSGMSAGESVMAAFFQSVTTRTAGFSTVDTKYFTESGRLLSIILMLVGAGPGSTGGGIKVTTAAVLVLSILAYAKGYSDTNVFGRRLEASNIRKTFLGATLYLILAMTGCFMILAFQDFSLSDTVFEAFSAIGTVGLSSGVTSTLSLGSEIVMILLMFSGRLGSLSVAMAVTHNRTMKLRSPEEKIVVG